MVFKYPCSRALNASILSKTLWVCAFRRTCSPRPSSKTPRWWVSCLYVLPDNILVCSQVCAYMYIIPKGNSAQAEVLLETYSYIHKYCAYMYIFPKGSSAQAEVLSGNISINSQKELCTYAYALGEKLCLNRDPAENISICSRIICSCEYVF
ncbi:hypothetical protein Taro_014577 [Colocasia esculenta]|uniref:Uncharacterized protein n=1 Tax=Colocasia esculenta TaxID=4460 RepID=A0A843UEX9_COLES|nr:hypothetical protein [Colocasia esculenta]